MSPVISDLLLEPAADGPYVVKFIFAMITVDDHAIVIVLPVEADTPTRRKFAVFIDEANRLAGGLLLIAGSRDGAEGDLSDDHAVGIALLKVAVDDGEITTAVKGHACALCDAQFRRSGLRFDRSRNTRAVIDLLMPRRWRLDFGC
jgi:hypothetical protein